MLYDFAAFRTRAAEIIAWLQEEFAAIRTGRATPLLIDTVPVESYGTRVPLRQVGTISVEDARTLRITVWDASQVPAVERAIAEADLGVSAATDEHGVRVHFPELTGERRAQLVKRAGGKCEEARVSLRAARDEAMRALDKKEKEGGIGKDELFAAKQELQKQVDTHNATFNTLLAEKEKEIAS